MSHDQRFFDIFTLVLGILVVIAIGIYVLSASIGNATQGEFIQSEADYQENIAARIRPVGQVRMPGEDVASPAAQASTPEPVATVMSGPQVYNAACIACHGAGIGGAPAYGAADVWVDRIAQGNDTLYRHAIEGYTGAAGFMPAKGGRTDLSDEEVRAAVDYMVEGSQ